MKNMISIWVLPVLGVLAMIGISPTISTAGDITATAQINGCKDSSISGTGVLTERQSEEGIKQVDVSLVVQGLTDGRHAVHIHETAACTPCGAAKGHHDPGPNSNSKPDAPSFNHPYHMGDLVNIEVKNGLGVMQTTTNRVTLSPGRLSIFDQDGASFIIHTNEDKYCDQDGELKKGCAGGSRDACGIIQKGFSMARHGSSEISSGGEQIASSGLDFKKLGIAETRGSYSH
jgi:Cu-Zn family superoxide dismutase